MFEPICGPRVIGVPLGADFPAVVAERLLSHYREAPPEALAKALILVNTRRMQRRLRSLFRHGRSRLLPRIGLVTDIAELVPDGDLPLPIPPLRRRLELARLIDALLDAEPDLAPRSAKFDLADSLAALLDEMQGEGVSAETLRSLDIADASGHWNRTQAFLGLVADYVSATSDGRADPEARRVAALDLLRDRWQREPPETPVLVVGSTGSRGTTLELMKLVATLPRGAVVLPGVDTHLPDGVWNTLIQDDGSEDHPQYRFAVLLNALGLPRQKMELWQGSPPSDQRNALVSLSLRPAPVTDQWLEHGPFLGDLRQACTDMSLIEARGSREEANAIAVAIREAVADGKTVALISPDRSLGRRVAASLARWNITPDDSAGRPLAQTAPGRFLRQTLRLLGVPATSEDLIALLKHPLTRTGGVDRGPHLLLTREFELFLRRRAIPLVGKDVIAEFASKGSGRADWCAWITRLLDLASPMPEPRLASCLDAHIRVSEHLARGSESVGAGDLWEKQAGRDALAAITALRDESASEMPLPIKDYVSLFDQVVTAANTRNADGARPDVMIWGTLEARVQGAEVIILGGLNDDVWPARPGHDPWLNRRLRREAGLLLPERQIGLSAHDYQQAIAAPVVILTRAVRDDEAETVPSRWVNRLTNLLNGLPEQGGETALKEMRARGHRYLQISRDLETPSAPVEPAPRPSPVTAPGVRPKQYSVTDIERLIRDPYHVYARRILGLRALDPLRPLPDARLRGTIYHDILEEVLKAAPYPDASALTEALTTVAERRLAQDVPWPAVARVWLGRLRDIAPGFARAEMQRQTLGDVVALEVPGEITLRGSAFTLVGKADRIDRLRDGSLAIFDYKTGQPPSADQIKHFQKQLLIEAVMAEAGGFRTLPAARVSHVEYIGLGRSGDTRRIELGEAGDEDAQTGTVSSELLDLLTIFADPAKGYPSRRAMESVRWGGDYDHLARFGEWDDTDKPLKIAVP